MSSSVTYKDNSSSVRTNTHIHPYVLYVSISCASIAMMFAAFTSAVIVRSKDPSVWANFVLPKAFTYSTIVVILSSVFLQLSYFSIKRGKMAWHHISLLLSILLGICFAYLQYSGWETMQRLGLVLKNNPSAGFVYVISGVHLVHILGGILFNFITFLRGIFARVPIQKRLVNMKVMLVYWHFVGVLWVYLFLFFSVYTK